MYWKYAFKPKDLARFFHDGKLCEGTVLGWKKNSAFAEVEETNSFDNIEPGDLYLVVNSGGEEVTVNLDDVEECVKFEDREGDVPELGERFRVNRGVNQ